MTKKTIFLLSNSLGGAEQILFNIAKYSNIKDIFVFYKSQNNIWEKAGFDVKYFNGSVVKMIQTISNRKFKTVYSSHIMMNALLGLFRKLNILHTDYLVCRESTSVFLRYKGIKLLKYKLAYCIGYKKIDLLITQSDSMKNVLLDNVPYLKNRFKIKTIPNPFVYPKNIVLNCQYDFPYIISAGRLIPEKGFDILIDAFHRLSFQYSELRLIILGEGFLRQELQEKIKELGLMGKVLMPGFVHNVYKYFKNAEVCVVSSTIEGFPNVLLQMMSQNNNIVSTLCAGGIENLKGVKTCITNNSTKLYEAINDVLYKDCTCNRVYFDNELKKRSIENFVKNIDMLLIE